MAITSTDVNHKKKKKAINSKKKKATNNKLVSRTKERLQPSIIRK